ncbi:MAG: LysR family transcriptional regulator [Bauldia sp.]|uniref:LysR family transcriptional regulator n=1 Tax=Bauldia sp. TaxID=2575872 RepID=UPI001DFA8A1D|nr:LysR family transcriptional regulator [Bauldia sp.]MCB1497192.1 LysR family transcriptional regulator [Bauldia sp.]
MLDALTLDQLRVLVAVAENGSFSAAARSLGRVQSAISQSVQSLENALGTPLFDRRGRVPKLNDAGRVILSDARRLLGEAATLKARAESIVNDIEAELTLAVDVIFPIEVLTACLKDLAETFPNLPVTLFTEGLGGAEQRLRDGTARLGLYVPFGIAGENREMEFLVSIPTVPVVAAGHPLAAIEGPVDREALEQSLQLVLTDRTPVSEGLSGGIISHRTWRFADQTTRLDFLLAGFGWCHMPRHMVRWDIAAGRLKELELKERTRNEFPIHVIHERGRPPGRAGRWLIDRIRQRLPECVGRGALPAAALSAPLSVKPMDPIGI